MKQHLDTGKWRRFFLRNQRGRPEPDWGLCRDFTEPVPGLLKQSLREFQLGDGGGPASLIAWNCQHYRNSRPGLAEVIDLWFDEEKEHSRLLGGMLQRYGAAPIAGHWSFSLFCSLRRWLGVTFELQALTLTELSSTAYYRLLRQHGPDPVLRQVCGLILRDESGHLAFQNDRLAAKGAPWSGPGRHLWRWQFYVSGWIAATVLWASHGRCLRAMGASTAGFYREATRQFSRFLLRLENRSRRVPPAFSLESVSPVHRPSFSKTG